MFFFQIFVAFSEYPNFKNNLRAFFWEFGPNMLILSSTMDSECM